MTETRLVKNREQAESSGRGEKVEGNSGHAIAHRSRNEQISIANTGRPRFNSRPTSCHVCGRFACPLISHRDYVFPAHQQKSTSRSSDLRTLAQSRGFRLRFDAQVLHPAQLLEIRNGKFDPFINLPMREQARDNDLFQHFFKISASRMVTATGRNATQNIITAKVLPIALQHPAVCQGAITYAAAQLANISGHTVPDQKDLIVYQKCLHLLTQSMKENPNQFKDILIFPALTIAGFDLTYGRKDELRRHLDSIHQVVKSIGGLHNLELGGVAAHVLLWLDFFGAILLNRKPLFDLPPRLNVTISGPPEVYGTAFEEMLERRAMDEKVLMACIQSCRLTELLEKITRDPGPSREAEYFTYKRHYIDYHLVVANADHLSTLDRTTCVCRAAMTLQFWILHNVGDTHAIFHHLGIELQKALLATDLVSFWGNDMDLLQWILFTAGSVMNRRNGSRWYQQLARQTLMKQYGENWPVNWRDLQKQNVRRFLWSEMFLEPPFHAFCHSITTQLQEKT